MSSIQEGNSSKVPSLTWVISAAALVIARKASSIVVASSSSDAMGMRLPPGMEVFPILRKVVPDSSGHLMNGRGITTFPIQTVDGRIWRIGLMICLEDTIPSFGRKLAGMKPQLLVNITDDSWFGDTSEPWQHLALSVYRSIELRTEMVRAVNPGISAYVDATGRVYAKTYASDPQKDMRGSDRILAEVALIEGGHTVYASIGDFFGYLCIALTLFLCQVLPRLRHRFWRQSETAKQ